jgi:hypothetical protein
MQGYAIVTVCWKTGGYTCLTGRGEPSVKPRDNLSYNLIYQKTSKHQKSSGVACSFQGDAWGS